MYAGTFVIPASAQNYGLINRGKIPVKVVRAISNRLVQQFDLTDSVVGWLITNGQ